MVAGKIEHALAITVQCVQFRNVWPSPSYGRGDAVCPEAGVGPHLGNLLRLDMSEAEIAATKAPRWQRTVMRAMARYGMYVVDTNGPDNSEMAIFTEDDQSFTSFGYPGEMREFVRSAGGGDGTLVGAPINVAKLRVIDPCVPRRTC